MQLCVEDLPDKTARAVFKDVSLDLINYGRLKMFIHAQGQGIDDGEVTAFLRLGTDFSENYYEIEVPLTITPLGTSGALPEVIWPKENEINVAFNELLALKSLRNRRKENINIRFADSLRQYKIYVKGRPDLSSAQTLMIGMRNPSGGDDEDPKTFCIWVNELRVTDFDNTAGWAANARINAQLADFANISASTRRTTVGFGGLQQKISERTREETQSYDVSANVSLDKLLPEGTGLQVPMYVSYEETTSTPKWDPLDPDTPLEASLLSFETDEEKQNHKDIVEDKTVRRSINFTNVRKVKTNPDSKSRVYDVENLSFTYAFSDLNSSNYTTESLVTKTYKGAVGYNFNPREISIEPFKKVGFLESPYLKLIKDFNFSPIPSSLGFRGDLDRRFTRIQYWNDELTTEGIDPNFEKLFTFNRSYNLRWNLTKSLSLDYDALASAIIDEPEEIKENGQLLTKKERKDSIWSSLKHFGRMQNYNQNVTATYKVPLDKLPFTDWIRADLRYGAGYNWSAQSIRKADSLTATNSVDTVLIIDGVPVDTTIFVTETIERHLSPPYCHR